MQFKYSSDVRNTLENVWDFAMDFERRPEWIHFFDKCYITHKTENWVGTTYKEKSVFLGIPLYIEYTITIYEHQKQMSSHCKMPPFFPTVHISVWDNGDGTIHSVLEFDIKLGPFVLVPKSIIKKQVDNIIHPFIDKFVEIMDVG
jgi:hypothetical protein